MKIVRGIRQFVSNSSVSVRALVVSNRGVSPFVSNSCISVRALVQETKASMDDSIAMLIKADGFMGPLLPELYKKNPENQKISSLSIFKEWTRHCLLARVFVIFRTGFFSLRNGVAIPPVSVLPQKINPEGLSEECRNYLYREIRQLHQFHGQWTLSAV